MRTTEATMERTRTEPVMPNRAQNERRGPEIYVHLEFRVSWNKKQPGKNHQVTYRSKGLRERAPPFPRQVPAPNTNYLAAIHNFDVRQSRVREWRQNVLNNHPSRHHQMQEYYQQGEQPRGHLQVPIIREPQRPTRADAPPNHERGRSAPPPLGENPWDVNVPHGQPVPPEASNRPWEFREVRRKPLPPKPSEFRLGEGGQPWSEWSYPEGYDPDTHPKDEEEERAHRRDRPSEQPLAGDNRNSATYATNPTEVSVFSPEPSSSPPRPPPQPQQQLPQSQQRDIETGRARDLGALSAAMMTVDNGFENQWWYQGPRRSMTVASDPEHDNHQSPQTPTRPAPLDESPTIQRWSTDPMYGRGGDEVDGESTLDSLGLPRHIPTGVVSPLTEAAFSPQPTPAFLLQRTMSTRSEELWFREGGRFDRS